MLRSGLSLDDPADLALCAASHSGEPMHISRVRAMLAAGGLTESDLRTPPDLPLSETARADVLRAGGGPAPVYMNCSGKHTGMLLTCVAAGWPIDDYRCPITRCRSSSAPPSRIWPASRWPRSAWTAAAHRSWRFRCARWPARSCDVPRPRRSDERRVADAMRAHPTLVSGTGADDERLMPGVPGLLSKGGAEGVLAVAVPAPARSRSRSTTVRCARGCPCSSPRSQCLGSRPPRSTRWPRPQCSAVAGGSVRCARWPASDEVLVRFGCRRAGNAP